MSLTYQPLLDKAIETELRRRLHFDSLMTASQLLPGAITTNSWTPNLSMTCRSENIRITFLNRYLFTPLPPSSTSLLHTVRLLHFLTATATDRSRWNLCQKLHCCGWHGKCTFYWVGVLRGSTGHFIRKQCISNIILWNCNNYIAHTQFAAFNTIKRRLAHHLARRWARGGKSLFSHRRFWTAKGTSSG